MTGTFTVFSSSCFYANHQLLLQRAPNEDTSRSSPPSELAMPSPPTFDIPASATTHNIPVSTTPLRSGKPMAFFLMLGEFFGA